LVNGALTVMVPVLSDLRKIPALSKRYGEKKEASEAAFCRAPD
jgi:hypothetical protein